MCVRTRVRSIHGLEFETTQFSGDSSQPTYLSRLQAAEFAARLSDDEGEDFAQEAIPLPSMYIHPTSGGEVLEYWTSSSRSIIFHLNEEGFYDVSELCWDE
jgi:hypothetical protein